jgi:hypothetical protein
MVESQLRCIGEGLTGFCTTSQTRQSCGILSLSFRDNGDLPKIKIWLAPKCMLSWSIRCKAPSSVKHCYDAIDKECTSRAQSIKCDTFPYGLSSLGYGRNLSMHSVRGKCGSWFDIQRAASDNISAIVAQPRSHSNDLPAEVRATPDYLCSLMRIRREQPQGKTEHHGAYIAARFANCLTIS